MISILILTHNAHGYVEKALTSLRRLTSGVEYEVVVVDNNSRAPTRQLLARLSQAGLIERLELLGYNSLFAKGNNIAARLASPRATHLLLLNSDVEIRSPEWLSFLVEHHQGGLTSLGVQRGSPIARLDGYCLLCDRALYDAMPLDEGHQWWWAVTKLQARALNAGHRARGFARHERLLHHFGGKSGGDWRGARGMKIDPAEVIGWFEGKSVEIIDEPA